jgi:hypothetical protein
MVEQEEMMEEPTVLDYVKARLTPWRGPAPSITDVEDPVDDSGDLIVERQSEQGIAKAEHTPRADSNAASFPWLLTGALLLALAAQYILEPGPDRSWVPGLVLYTVAGLALGAAFVRGELSLSFLFDSEKKKDPLTIHLSSLWIGIILGLVSFVLMGNNRFETFNVIFWFGSIFFVARAFWLPNPDRFDWLNRLSAAVRRTQWNFKISPWNLLLLGVLLVIVFFRVYQVEQVPSQMVSDHAEKLLDVWDVLHGETMIFFPRNTGREPLQMYVTAWIVQLFGTDFSFLSLKIGTILAGLLTLPFLYFLGKEVGGTRVALLVLLFAGIAYWPNVISRVGLRFPFYPLFVASTLFFLIRGIKRSSRNDFILAGLSLGIGLHGYTPIRILPFLIVAAIAIYLLHRHSIGLRRQTIWSLVVLAFVSLMVFIPLLRYSYTDPTMFGYRAFSRLGTFERPLPGPPAEIFLNNLGRASVMFSWDNGQIWPVSVTNRPALDVVSGALFHLGLALVLLRYIRHRHWLDLFLLVSIPMLMLPSILSLAYPDENPALNRASGVIIPVFLIIAIALDSLMTALKNRLGNPLGKQFAWGLAVGLFVIAAAQNYDLVFNQYRRSYDLSSWNTTEMGRVIHRYANSVGSLDSAWVVAYPHWVDTRLVGMNAGNTARDYAVFPENLEELVDVPGPKLFLVNIHDSNSIEVLENLFPQGWLTFYESEIDFKDFLIYMVPPSQGLPHGGTGG